MRENGVVASGFEVFRRLINVFLVCYRRLHDLHVGEDVNHLGLTQQHSRSLFFLLAAAAEEKTNDK